MAKTARKKTASRKSSSKKTNRKKTSKSVNKKAVKKRSGKSVPKKKTATKAKKKVTKKKTARKKTSARKKAPAAKKKPARKKAIKKRSKKASKTVPAKGVNLPKKAVRKNAAKTSKALRKKVVGSKNGTRRSEVAEANPKPKATKVLRKASTRIRGVLPIDRKKTTDPYDMPKPVITKTHLSKKKLAGFKKLLLEYRDRYVDEINFLSGDLLSSRESSGDLSNYSLHMADQGTDNFRQELNLSLVSSDHDILWEIDQALKRVERGTYGVCELTGKPIGLERLKAMPYTRFSIEAQEMIERGKLKYRPLGGTLKHGG